VEARVGAEEAARLRDRFDELDIVRLTSAVLLAYMEETGRRAILEHVLEQDLDRKDAGLEPLPDLGLELPTDEMEIVIDRVVDRVIAEA
jgi:hypothetical protein